MALVAADSQRFRIGPALFWSLTWGLGAGLGVALGGWLTVVGGSGAPGTEGLDLGADLVALPIVALVAVSSIHLVGQVVASALRGRSRKGAQGQDAEQRGEDDRVTG